MRDGNDKYRNGDVEGALAFYRKAWTTTPSFDVACNLGRAELELKRYRDAAEHLDFCVRNHTLSSKPEAIVNEQQAREALKNARQRVGTIRLTVEPEGAEVSLDGKGMGRAPLSAPVFVEPGLHTIRATLVGFVEESAKVDVSAGNEGSVAVKLRTEDTAVARVSVAPSSLPPARETLRSEPSATNPIPWILSGVAVVGVGVGVAMLVLAGDTESEKDTALRPLPEAQPCGRNTPHVAECARADDLSSKARTQRTVAFITLGAGLAAAAGAATVWLWPAESDAAKSRAAQSQQLVPVIAPGHLGFSFETTF